MKWKRIIKNKENFPTTGHYSDWKEILADEAGRQCVYCCIHESRFGGIRNYHVEHFRPKSKFKHLTDDYGNLFYACAICNSFKGNDWPREPILGVFEESFYPDPSLIDYADIMEVDDESGRLFSGFATGRFLIEKLFLNRPQMIVNRRMEFLKNQILGASSDLRNLIDSSDIPDDLCRRVVRFMSKALQFMDEVNSVVPYQTSDVERT
ncbi:HNH endonuclease [Burkholderia cepacia]|uniref:HNH endonuclease n=1 Tax=Burkholderia cepacia TaxID=292 RepID=UPI002FDFB69D